MVKYQLIPEGEQMPRDPRMVPLKDGSSVNCLFVENWNEEKIKKLVREDFQEVLRFHGILTD